MLVDTVRKTVEKYGLLEKGDKVLVAVSGGPDSTALLLALDSLKYDYGLKLHIAHLDHMFRPAVETKKDHEYVLSLSRKLCIPLTFKRIDACACARKSGFSLEEAAREKRYEFLLKAAKDSGSNKIAMGHTLDDQAETVVMRLVRGSGLGGLRGIPPVRPLDGVFIIRPLIECRRKDVEGYLKGMGTEARQDMTNLMPKFLRNRIRHELMVLLEKYNPNIKEVLSRSAQNFSSDYEVISGVVDKVYLKAARSKAGAVIVDLKKLKGKKAGIRRGVLRKAIETSKGDLKGIDFSHIEDIEGLACAGSGAVDLPGRVRVTREKDSLVFRTTDSEPAFPKVCKQLSVPGTTPVPELKLVFEAKLVKSGIEFGKPGRSAEYMDLGKMEGPLYVRMREKGDRFKPLGMSRMKKLQDFFVDLKVPRGRRDRTPLIVSGKTIVWVCGLRLSDDAKITGATKSVVRISYKPA